MNCLTQDDGSELSGLRSATQIIQELATGDFRRFSSILEFQKPQVRIDLSLGNNRLKLTITLDIRNTATVVVPLLFYH
jgi:hypothetical protein